MKRLLLLFVVGFTPAWAQQTLPVSLDPGLNIYNSENSLKTIGDKALDWSPGFSVGYEGVDLRGVPLRFEYSYTRSSAHNALEFAISSSSGPEPMKLEEQGDGIEGLVEANQKHMVFLTNVATLTRMYVESLR